MTDAPGKLSPLSLGMPLPARAQSVTGTTDGAASVDALLLQPVISSVVVTGTAGESTVYVSASPTSIERKVAVPKGFQLSQRGYDSTGQSVKARPGHGADRSGRVTIAPGGFTVVSFVAK